MGEVVKGDFPDYFPDDRDFYGLIEENKLNTPIIRTSAIMFGKEQQELPYESIHLYNSEGSPTAYLEGDALIIDAPLSWIGEVSEQARQEYGADFAELAQSYLITTIYAKKWLDRLDNNRKRKRLLDVTPKTQYKIGRKSFNVEYHCARDLGLWRGASALSLKAVSSREQSTRQRLLEFLENQYDIELEIQLKEQHFSSKKDFLSRLMNKNKLYSLDGYKMACFDPMTDEELLKLSPEFLRAANS